ncbi:MAG: oxidoreductase [Pseudomonadota bacterium]
MSKVWFITGCSKGFGKVLVEELLQHTNACVVATARDVKTIEHFAKQYPARVCALSLDVTKTSDITSAVEVAIKQFHRIDILVNNAGYGLVGAIEECSIQDIRAVFDTNVFGLIEVTKAILPHMRAQSSGHIFNISSIAGLRAGAGYAPYSGTKFAVEGISEALALDVEGFGIKVTLIEPGPFRTDFAGDSIKIADPHPDYKNSKAFAVREYLSKMNNNQPGDPVKAVKIIIQVSEMRKPPLRLLLGSIALERMHAKLEYFTSEMREYEALTKSADYDDQE